MLAQKWAATVIQARMRQALDRKRCARSQNAFAEFFPRQSGVRLDEILTLGRKLSNVVIVCLSGHERFGNNDSLYSAPSLKRSHIRLPLKQFFPPGSSVTKRSLFGTGILFRS